MRQLGAKQTQDGSAIRFEESQARPNALGSDMIEWFSSIESVQSRFEQILASAGALQRQVYSSGQLDGWCAIGRRDRRFRLPVSTDGSWSIFGNALSANAE